MKLQSVKIYALLATHFGTTVLGIAALMCFPEDKLRWNMGNIIAWLILLSALLMVFSIPKEYKYRKALKRYLYVFFGVPVAGFVASIFVWVLAVIEITILCNMFIPDKPIFENEHYTLRAATSPMNRSYHIYKKEMFVEKHLGRIDNSFSPDDYVIRSVNYDSPSNRSTIVCADTTFVFELQ